MLALLSAGGRRARGASRTAGALALRLAAGRVRLASPTLFSLAVCPSLPLLVSSAAASSSSFPMSAVSQQSGGSQSYCDWTKEGVNPDVISSNPATQLKVTYGAHHVVTPSEILAVKDTQHAPKLEWAPQEPTGAAGTTQLYTVIMCDPDAPSRKDPKFRCWLHWLVVNVPSPHQIGEGYVVAEYQGPAPPAHTGLHRYVFLIYKQKGVIPANEVKAVSDDKRGGWKLNEFLETHQFLIDSGVPIAGNLFQAQNVKQ